MNKVHLYVADKHATLCGMWNREHGMQGNNKPHLVTCKLCKALMAQGFPKESKPAVIHLQYSSRSTECGLDMISANIKMSRLASEVTCKRCLIAINKLENEPHNLDDETVTYLQTARNHIRNMLHIKVPTEMMAPISQMGLLIHALSYDDLILLLEAIKYHKEEVAHINQTNRVILYNLEKAAKERLHDTSTYTSTEADVESVIHMAHSQNGTLCGVHKPVYSTSRLSKQITCEECLVLMHEHSPTSTKELLLGHAQSVIDSTSSPEDEVLDPNSTIGGPFLLVNKSNNVPSVTMHDTLQDCLDWIAKKFSGKQAAIELNKGEDFTVHTLTRLPIKVTTQVEFKVSIKSNPCFPYTALD